MFRKMNRGTVAAIAVVLLAIILGVFVFLVKDKKRENKKESAVESTSREVAEGIQQVPAEEATEESGEEAQGTATDVSHLGAWDDEDADWMQEVTVVNAKLPGSMAEKMSAQEYIESGARYDKYPEELAAARTVACQLTPSLKGFYDEVAKALLGNTEGNAVCSPLNIYMALSLLAEVTDGNSQKQLLEFLSADDIDALRKNADALWNSNFMDTPANKSILANSLWLNQSVDYDMETLERLATEYHAYSFVGDPGSEAMTKGLRSWTNKATGGLLEQYVQNMELKPEMVLDIVSTLYYHAMWQNDFLKELTQKEVFHGAHGDTTVDMMHQQLGMAYRSEKVTAVNLYLKDGAYMYFYLPKEGVEIEELVADPEIFWIRRRLYELGQELTELGKTIDYQDGEAVREYDEIVEKRYADYGWTFPIVHASIPKFQVEQKTDLKELLVREGMTDILDPAVSDFTPLTKEGQGIALDKAEHAATIQIDEEGVTGAAYVEEFLLGAASDKDREEIDFVLDRPFLFALYSLDGSILFEGIVRDICD